MSTETGTDMGMGMGMGMGTRMDTGTRMGTAADQGTSTSASTSTGTAGGRSAGAGSSITLGEVEIIRVVEWEGAFGPARRIVPEAGIETWQADEELLAPHFWEPEGDQWIGALQTWVLRSGGRTVLVDTNVGNGRERPSMPMFHHRNTDFLGQLAAAGVRPEDVDVVVNTHLHADHVGWNTVGQGPGTWVPAFPNATYLMPAADHAHFDPANGRALRPDDVALFEDSVAPVVAAGQAVLWEGEHRIDENLVLEAAPGHTPGSSVLRLASRGERAVFVGDLLHSPVQIAHPSHNSCFCEDGAGAAATRHRILGRAADERELVVPAHFGGPGAFEVRREAGTFAVRNWAAYGV
ncbi:MBL fold metallo-hydrolase [Streptomyces hundungensis]|uniref:MBL fold metallo-hydrolase n=1 Tax=Streptomyces hundungensis TaxID=1077946 RepID=UPI0031EF2EA9